MAQPPITFDVEPTVDAKVRYLRSAPEAQGGVDKGLLNLALIVRNSSAASVAITRVQIKVVGSSTGEENMQQLVWIPARSTGWYTPPRSHVFSIPSGSTSLRLKVHAQDFSDPVQVTLPLVRHASPGGAYRFWGAVRDLRPTEFWQVIGLHHSHDNPAQVHGYDVNVAGGDGAARSSILPGGSWSRNEDYRIWGKPVYAVADGVVLHRRDDFPCNAVANAHPNAVEQARIDALPDGNGNFLTISGNGETVLYAHMIPGSLNPDLTPGAAVKAGDFLGQVGNSGQSTGPHLHIHANRDSGDAFSWVGLPRALTWINARTVAWSLLGENKAAAPWVLLAGRGMPLGDSAVWPSDNAVQDLREPAIGQFTVSTTGQVWVVRKADGRVRYAAQPLPRHGYVGAFLDQNPGGIAKGIAVHGSQPYLIGSDNKVWEGKSTGWVVIPGGPSVKRIAVDASTGTLWCITSTSAIHSFRPATRTWHTHAGSGQGRDICAHDGVPYIIGTDAQVYKSAGAAGWTLLPGGGQGKRISVDTVSGKLWVIGSNDGVWAYQGASGWNEHAHQGRAREIFVHERKPYIIGLQGDALWRSAGSAGWHRMNVVEPA